MEEWQIVNLLVKVIDAQEQHNKNKDIFLLQSLRNVLMIHSMPSVLVLIGQPTLIPFLEGYVYEVTFEQIHSVCSGLVLHMTGAQAVKCCIVLCEHMLSVGFSGVLLLLI